MKTLLISLLTMTLGLASTAQGSIDYKTTEQKLNDDYCSGMFRTTEGTILDVASSNGVSSYLNILDWLQGRVAGLQVYMNRSGVSIPVIRGRVPGIFVDEQQVSVSYLNQLSVHDIAMVKVIKTPFLGGFNSGGGAIAIYTLGGEEDEMEDNSK